MGLVRTPLSGLSPHKRRAHAANDGTALLVDVYEICVPWRLRRCAKRQVCISPHQSIRWPTLPLLLPNGPGDFVLSTTIIPSRRRHSATLTLAPSCWPIPSAAAGIRMPPPAWNLTPNERPSFSLANACVNGASRKRLFFLCNVLHFIANVSLPVCDLLGALNVVLSSYLPNANGGTERVNQT